MTARGSAGFFLNFYCFCLVAPRESFNGATCSIKFVVFRIAWSSGKRRHSAPCVSPLLTDDNLGRNKSLNLFFFFFCAALAATETAEVQLVFSLLWWTSTVPPMGEIGVVEL